MPRVTPSDFIAANRAALEGDHRWELKFVEDVLAQVPGLDFCSVQVQKPFIDDDGRSRRIDFTITEPSGVRIALEVDGWDKRGTGTGMTRVEFVDWSRREQAIVAQGWRLLRFANTLVRHEPERCARNIQLTLELERALAEQVETAHQGARATAEALRAAEARAADAERRLSDAVQAADAAGDGGERARLQRQVENRRDDAEESHRLHAASVADAARGLLSPHDAAELQRAETDRQAALRTQEREQEQLTRRVETAEKENQGMKIMAVAFAVVAVAVAVIVIFLADGGNGDPSPTGGSPSAGAGICKDAVDWQDAADRVGQRATIAGPVVSASYQRQSAGAPTFLNVGRPFGDDRRFVVLIFGRYRAKFPESPERAYSDKRIAVTGSVSEFRGVAQIDVRDPSQIAAC